MYEYQCFKTLHLYENNDATYPAHFHSHCEVIFVESGSVTATVDGKTYTAGENQAIFVAPHQVHSYASRYDVKIYVMFAAPLLVAEYVSGTSERVPASPVISFSSERDLALYRSLLAFIKEEIEAAQGADTSEPPSERSGRETTVKLAARTALALMLDHTTWRLKSDASPESTTRILDYCLTHYRSDISLTSVARALGISPNTVTHAFSAVFGCGFRRYINSIRIAEAAEHLIQSTEPITQIAYAVGFDTLRTFNRAFLYEKGVTPSEYRKNHGKCAPEERKK